MHLLNSFECPLPLCNWQPFRVLMYRGSIAGIDFVSRNSCLAEIIRSAREDVFEFEQKVAQFMPFKS